MLKKIPALVSVLLAATLLATMTAFALAAPAAQQGTPTTEPNAAATVEPTQAATTTVTATEEATSTAVATATVEATVETTATTAMTATEEVTATAAMTATEEVTVTTVATTTEVTKTTIVTGTCAQDYNVQANDSLGKIAETLLGSSAAYTTILEATQAAAQTDSSYATISDPSVIQAGWKLCIPATATSATPVVSSTVTIPAGKGLLRYDNTTGFDMVLDTIGPSAVSGEIATAAKKEFVLDPGQYKYNTHSPAGELSVNGGEFEIVESKVTNLSCTLYECVSEMEEAVVAPTPVVTVTETPMVTTTAEVTPTLAVTVTETSVATATVEATATPTQTTESSN